MVKGPVHEPFCVLMPLFGNEETLVLVEFVCHCATLECREGCCNVNSRKLLVEGNDKRWATHVMECAAVDCTMDILVKAIKK